MEKRVEESGVNPKTLEAFERGYPHLTMKVAFESRGKRLGAWTATVRTRESGQMVTTGIRRDAAKAVDAALEGIPEKYRRAPVC
jgi:hypothetical protein